MDNRYTFKKEERISAQREIDLLFEKGISFISYPLRVVYFQKKTFSGADASVLISVPKKKFKKAVYRNRLKRLIRESYRLNKMPLLNQLQEKDCGLLIAFLFVGKELSGFKEIETAVIKALASLKEKII
ncbi:ribonuclease P protein component [Bacteroidia bacterium]|nr:ribonuclease P protein component [Bacteroidia bacterium]GHV71421.1 ribonuclease P protein component [Bacteroidia bacterium]